LRRRRPKTLRSAPPRGEDKELIGMAMPRMLSYAKNRKVIAKNRKETQEGWFEN
jgi:hypothetical protein